MQRSKLNAMLGLSEQELDELAKPYEDGTWSAQLGEITPGRPRLTNEELRTVSFKLPDSRLRRIDEIARTTNKTRSQVLRYLIERAVS